MQKDDDQVKSVFACFGRALYLANVVEIGLVLSLLQVDFFSAAKAEALSGAKFDRGKFNSDFDAFMDKHFAQTMGNLVKRVEAFAALGEKLKVRIRDAKNRRDYLSHHFWREQAEQFGTSKGREAMIAALQGDADGFES
jgi:hypothetical protein